MSRAPLVLALLLACACVSSPRAALRPAGDMFPLRQPAARTIEKAKLAAFRHYFAVTGVTDAAHFFRVTYRDGETIESIYAVPQLGGETKRSSAARFGTPQLVRESWGGIPPLTRDDFDSHVVAAVQAIRADVERYHGAAPEPRVQYLGYYRELHVREWMPVDFAEQEPRTARWAYAVIAVDAALQAPLRVLEWGSGLTLLCGAFGSECDRAHFLAFDIASPSAVLQLPTLLAKPLRGSASDSRTTLQRDFVTRLLAAASAIARGEPPAGPMSPATTSRLPEDLDMHLDVVLRVGEGAAPLEHRIALPLNDTLFAGHDSESRFMLGGVPMRARIIAAPSCPLARDDEGERDARLRIKVDINDDRGRRVMFQYWLEGSFLIANGVVALASFEIYDQFKPLPVPLAAQVLLDRIAIEIEHTAISFNGI